MTKTLKQLLDQSSYLNPWKESGNKIMYTYKAQEIIREWLMQKRQEIPNPTKDFLLTSLTTRLDNALIIGKKELIDELLEELQNDN